MKKTHKNLADTDDEMDNLPLKYISSSQEKYRSIKDLRRYSVHSCEFCEETFENSYDYLIHNAKHIIIPLIKMLPYHCGKCGVYYLSEVELKDHISHVHKTFGMPKAHNGDDCNIMVSDRCNFVMAEVKEELNEDEIPIKYLIKKSKENNVVPNNVSENILQNFVMNCKVDVEKFVAPWLRESDERDDKSSNIVNTHENNFKNHVAEFGPSKQLNNITENNIVSFKNNVVKFKSSIEEHNVIKNNVSNLENPVADYDCSSEFSDLDDDPIVILAPVKKEIVKEYHNEHNSIHFDDLIKPGIFYCKRCYKRFPNRYEVIVHEIVHLDLSKAAPESYKAMYNKQSASAIKRVKTYDHCHDEVSDETLHAKICFRWNCPSCSKGFNSRIALDAHEDQCKGEFVVNMCDSCLYLKERPKHLQYYSIVRLNTLEVKHVCHWCAKLCKDVSLVTIISRQRLADRIKFESDLGDQHVTDPKLEVWRKVNKQVVQRKKTELGAGRGSKILSNRERLKLIQSRLKLMKK